jgi:hypothetical protein
LDRSLLLAQRSDRLWRPVAIAVAFKQFVGPAPDWFWDLLRIDTHIAGNCCDSHHSQSNFFVAYGPLALSARCHISELDGKFTARDGAVVIRKPNIKPTRAPESLA